MFLSSDEQQRKINHRLIITLECILQTTAFLLKLLHFQGQCIYANI